VPDGDHVVDADIWCDGGVARKVEVDQQRNEFVEASSCVAR
jgi:hypothetical protein